MAGAPPQSVSARHDLARTSSPSFSDQPHPEWLRLAIVQVAAFAVIGNVVLALHSPYARPGWLPDWVIATATLMLALPSGLIVVAALQRRPDLRPARTLVVAASAANVLVALSPHTGTPPPGTPFVNGSTVVAACLAAVSFRSLRRGLVWIAVLALGYSAVRAPVVGWPVALLESSVTALGSLAVGIFTTSIASVFDSVSKAEAARARARDAAMAHEQQERVRREWDRVVHDKVLGALTTAARSTSFEQLLVARTLAADALRALGVVEPSGDDSRSLVALGAGLGITVHGDDHLPKGLPDDVVDALMAGAAEALANVGRHAGVDRATVEVAGNANEVVVRVCDEGAGFDARSTGDRFGLARSIPGHMADVGGSAVIESALGIGTTVTLSWQAEQAEEPQPSAVTQGPRSGEGVPVTVVVPPVWVVLNVALGWASTRDVYTDTVMGWPPLVWCGAAIIFLAVLLAAQTASWAAPTSLVLSAAAVGVLAAVTPAAGGVDWRLWFSGATLPLPVLFALSGRERAAWGYAVLNPLAIAAGLSVHGPGTVLSFPEVLLAPWIVTVPSVMAMRALRRARQELRSASEETSRLRRADHTLTLSAAAARQRREELSKDVIPLLTRLWQQEVFDADDRLAATLAEAAARDRLVAGSLVDDQLAEAVAGARARGARVDLRATGDSEQPGVLSPFRAVAALLMATCGAHSRATVQWHPRGEADVATVAIVAPASLPREQSVSNELEGIDHVFEHDEEEIWLALNAPRARLSPFGGTPPTERGHETGGPVSVRRVQEREA